MVETKISRSQLGEGELMEPMMQFTVGIAALPLRDIIVTHS